MKKFYQIAAFAAAAIILNGCCHVQVHTEPVTTPDNPVPSEYQVVSYGKVNNSGYYLFNVLPIYTGHPGHPNRKDYRAFNDDIRPQVNAAILMSEMQRLYKAEKLADVEHQESSWGYFSLWILWRKNITTTAVGVKKTLLKPSSKK